MTADPQTQWLDWARKIQAIAQTGLSFTDGIYDRERYHELSALATEILAEHSDLSASRLTGIFSADAGYTTPKLDVRAAVMDAGRILLVRETESGAWTLPGGYVDVNEPLSRATEREVFEESGILARAIKVCGIYDHRRHGYKPHLYHFYKIYMLCEPTGGTLAASIETSEARYFTREDVSSLSLDPGRVARVHVERMFEHWEKQDLPTDFD